MLLHTNSIFSNKFKDDVAKLLDKLSCNGNITIQCDKLKINNSADIDPFKIEYECTQTYDNVDLVAFIQCEINKGRTINLAQYDRIHCSYFNKQYIRIYDLYVYINEKILKLDF
jgi:hypothetical protein